MSEQAPATMEVEIPLPYFKQGVDFNQCLRREVTAAEAAEAHAEMLEEGAGKLRKLAELLSDVPAEQVGVQADTHIIYLELPPSDAERLLKAGVAREGEI